MTSAHATWPRRSRTTTFQRGHSNLRWARIPCTELSAERLDLCGRMYYWYLLASCCESLTTSSAPLHSPLILRRFLNYWPLKKLPFMSSWNSTNSSLSFCNDTLNSWIEQEATHSWIKIFEQLGPPAGATVREGFVIASPSTKDPDYFYTWTREWVLVPFERGTVLTFSPSSSAIVTSAILQKLQRTGDTSLESHLRLFAYSQKALQHVCNPSGCFAGGMHGLGEPKFNVDGTAFVGSWGRPQRVRCLYWSWRSQH